MHLKPVKKLCVVIGFSEISHISKIPFWYFFFLSRYTINVSAQIIKIKDIVARMDTSQIFIRRLKFKH